MFVTTQYVGEAAYCDLVGVMYEGKLLMVDTPDGLLKKAYGGEIVSIKTNSWITDQSRRNLEALPSVQGDVKLLGDQEMELIVDEASTAIPELMDALKGEKVEVVTIEQINPPFDDVFVRLIERETVDDQVL